MVIMYADDLHQAANALLEKADEIRGKNSSITITFSDLVGNGVLNDAFIKRFDQDFREGTEEVAALADRCNRHAEFLEKLANKIDNEFGGVIHVPLR